MVHTHLPTPWSADWSVQVGRARGKGVVLTYYNDIVGDGPAGAVARLYNSLPLWMTLRLAHRVVVNSKNVLQRPRSPLRGLSQKIRVVLNGVDTARLYPKPELRRADTIGFLAVLDEFHRYKGLDVLLGAIRQLACRGREVRVIVGGEGALRAQYEQMATALQVRAQVEFRGFIQEDHLLDFFNTCRIFILPTTDAQQEGFGMVALEAAACGLPVVVTSAAGIAEVLRECDAGVVVPPQDPTALAEAIELLLLNPGRAERLGRQAREAAEVRFSWTAIAREYERIYNESLAS